MNIHPELPLADGTFFRDTHRFSPNQTNFLAGRGVVFLTEFNADGSRYGGDIIATSFAEAEKRAKDRGLNEKVIGTLEEVIN